MYRSSHYHAEADHARRLAEMTIQPNLVLELRRVAEEFDRLADALVAGELEFNHPEIFEFLEKRGPLDPRASVSTRGEHRGRQQLVVKPTNVPVT